MPITTCPHCHMRIWPRPDGTCPSCNGLITQTEATAPASKSSAAVIKRAAKAADKKKTASRSSKASGSAQRAGYRTALPGLPADGQGRAPKCLARFLSLPRGGDRRRRSLHRRQLLHLAAESGGYRLQARVPGPLSWVLIWGGIVVCLGLIVLGADQGRSMGARPGPRDRQGPDRVPGILQSLRKTLLAEGRDDHRPGIG